jgi:monomeric isocitrate dehydrogenase
VLWHYNGIESKKGKKMNAIERKEAYADAHKTGLVMVESARRNFPSGSDALVEALAKAEAYVVARMDHIDGLFRKEV